MIRNIFNSVKKILFIDPKLLYEEEMNLVNQPFYFQGTNGKAVLLVHGWTSTPYEVRRLGKYLSEEGYTVYAPLLKGHGTVPEDLENISWTDWIEDLEKAFDFLLKEKRKIYVGGTSIGANLALILAAKKNNIFGLILMAMPYRIKFESLSVAFAKFLKIFKSYNKKIYPPTFGLSTTITRLISYQTYPIQNILEVHKLIKKSREAIPGVIQPCLMIQSTHDHIIQKNSLELIYRAIGSKIKEKEYVQRAYHTFISDTKNINTFKSILKFLNEN